MDEEFQKVIRMILSQLPTEHLTALNAAAIQIGIDAAKCAQNWNRFNTIYWPEGAPNFYKPRRKSKGYHGKYRRRKK